MVGARWVWGEADEGEGGGRRDGGQAGGGSGGGLGLAAADAHVVDVCKLGHSQFLAKAGRRRTLKG